MTRLLRPPSPAAALAALALASPALSPSLFALVDLPGGRITLITTLSETYDSYMIGTPDRGSDNLTTLAPELRYNHLIGPTGLSLYGGAAFNRYARYSRFDSDDFHTGITTSLPVDEGSPLAGRLNFAYSKATQIDQIVNDRVQAKTFSGGVDGSYRFGPKFSVSETAAYSQSQREIYGDQTIWSNGLKFTYEDFLEDTNLHVGDTYTRTKSSSSNYYQWAYDPALIGTTPNSSIDQTANTYSIGLARPLYGSIIGDVSYGYMVLDRQASETTAGNTTQKSNTISLDVTGPFLPPSRFPKVESSATLSYSQSQSPGINDSGQKLFGGNVRLAWNARERTRLNVGASRSTSLGANNFTVVTSGINAGVVENVGLATTLGFSTSYVWRSELGLNRHDTEFRAELNFRYLLNQYWAVGASYSYQNNRTNAKPTDFVAARFQLDDYTRHVVSGYITATF